LAGALTMSIIRVIDSDTSARGPWGRAGPGRSTPVQSGVNATGCSYESACQNHSRVAKQLSRLVPGISGLLGARPIAGRSDSQNGACHAELPCEPERISSFVARSSCHVSVRPLPQKPGRARDNRIHTDGLAVAVAVARAMRPWFSPPTGSGRGTRDSELPRRARLQGSLAQRRRPGRRGIRQ